MLRPSRQGYASWPPTAFLPLARSGGMGSGPALARGRLWGGSFGAVAMADALSGDLPAVQVLLDL
jgi:hypothetical protein